MPTYNLQSVARPYHALEPPTVKKRPNTWAGTSDRCQILSVDSQPASKVFVDIQAVRRMTTTPLPNEFASRKRQFLDKEAVTRQVHHTLGKANAKVPDPEDDNEPIKMIVNHVPYNKLAFQRLYR